MIPADRVAVCRSCRAVRIAPDDWEPSEHDKKPGHYPEFWYSLRGTYSPCCNATYSPVYIPDSAAVTQKPYVFNDVEALSARLHDIYQLEAHRCGDVRHADAYDDLSESTKEWDRVLARWIIAHWVPLFDPEKGLPPA